MTISNDKLFYLFNKIFIHTDLSEPHIALSLSSQVIELQNYLYTYLTPEEQKQIKIMNLLEDK